MDQISGSASPSLLPAVGVLVLVVSVVIVVLIWFRRRQ